MFSMFVFFAGWQVVAAVMDRPLLPTPLEVLENLGYHTASGELPWHMAVTLARVLASFVVAMAVGIAVGIAMGRSNRIDSALDGVLILMLNIPALVTIILCYLWFGLTEIATVVAVAINKIPTVVVTVREGARAIDRELIQVADAFQIGRRRTLNRVYLPQLYPYAMAAARSGLALIWKIVLVAELLGRSNGVGFQLGIFFQFFDITSILAYTLAFAMVIFIIEAVFMRPIDRRIARWRG
jgi:NitT/TauT family transport system permease protein